MLMHFIGLPLRNVLRNRRRTLITLFAITAGAVAILLFGGYSNAIVNGVQTGFVRQLGHLQVQKKDYFRLGSGSPTEYGISDYPKLVQAIRNDPQLRDMVAVVTPTLQMFGIAGNFEAGVSRTVVGVGVIPSDQNQMRQWNEYKFPGEIKPMALPEDQRPAAVIGQGLARVLHLCQGFKVPDCPASTDDTLPQSVEQANAANAPEDIVALSESMVGDDQAAASKQNKDGGTHMEILAAMSRGAPNVESVPIIAVESQGVKEVDDMYVALPLPLAQRLVYGQAHPQVTSVVVQLKQSGQLEQARARLQELIKGHGSDLEVLDYRTLNSTYDQIRGLFTSIFGFIAVLMGTIVLFSVANTMSMSVMERTVEIGTLRALGLCKRGVYQLFMTEGALIGVLGAGLGTSIALFIAWLINSSGLTWVPPSQVDPIPLVVHVFNAPVLIVGTFIGLTVVAIVSGLLPARRAARMDVVEALRHV